MWRLDIRLSCYRTPDFFVLSRFANSISKRAENNARGELHKRLIIFSRLPERSQTSPI